MKFLSLSVILLGETSGLLGNAWLMTLLYILGPVLALLLLGYLLWRFLRARRLTSSDVDVAVNNLVDDGTDFDSQNENDQVGDTSVSNAAINIHSSQNEPDSPQPVDVPTEGFDLAAPENAEFDLAGDEQEDLLVDMHREGNQNDNFDSGEFQLEDASHSSAEAATPNLGPTSDEFDLELEDIGPQSDDALGDAVVTDQGQKPAEPNEPNAANDIPLVSDSDSMAKQKQQFQQHDEFDLSQGVEEDEFDLSDDTEQGFDTDMEGLSLEESNEFSSPFDNETNQSTIEEANVLDEPEAQISASDTAIGLDRESEEILDESIDSPPAPPVLPNESSLNLAASVPSETKTDSVGLAANDSKSPASGPTAPTSAEDQEWIANAKIELEKLNRLNQDLLDDRTYLNQVMMQQEEAQANFDQKLNAQITQNEELTTANSQLKAQEESLQRTVEDLQTTYDELTSKVTGFQENMESLEEEANSSAPLRTELEAKTTELANLQSELKLSNQEKQQLRTTLDNLKSDHEELQSTKLTLDIEKSDLEKQLQAELKNVAAQSQAIDELKKENAKLSNEMENALKEPSEQQRSLLSQLQSDLDSSQQSQTTLKNQLTTLTSDNAQLKSSFDQAKTEVPESKAAELVELRNQLENAESQRSSDAMELRRLASELADAKHLADVSNAQLAEITEKAKHDASQIGLKFETLEARLRSRKAELDKLKDELAETKTTAALAAHASDELAAAQNLNTELKAKLRTTEKNVASLTSQQHKTAEEAKSAIESGQQTIAQLETELQQSKIRAEKLDGLQVELETAQKSISNYEFELSEAQQKSLEIATRTEEQIAHLNEELEREKRTVGSFELELATYKSEAAKVTQLEAQLAASQERLGGDEEKSRKDFEQQIRELKAKVAGSEKLEAELEASNKKQASLISEIDQLKQEAQTRSSEITELKKAKKQIEKLESLKKEHDEFKKTTKAELSAATKLTKTTSANAAKLETKLKKSETQITNLKEKLQAEIKAGRERVKEAKKEVAAKVAQAKKEATEKAKTKSPIKRTKTTKKSTVKPKRNKASKSDDLTKVEGIGSKIRDILYAADIHTFKKLSKRKPDQLRKILNDAGNQFASHDPETWPRQAELADQGDWKQLAIWQDELDGGKQK